MRKSPYEMVDAKIDALNQIEELVASGMKVRQSVQIVADTTGISIRTLFRCRNLTSFLPREKWRDALACKWPRAKCHPAAIKELVELCSTGIGVSESYRRTLSLSEAERWGPLPSEQVMRRQLMLYIAHERFEERDAPREVDSRQAR